MLTGKSSYMNGEQLHSSNDFYTSKMQQGVSVRLQYSLTLTGRLVKPQ